MGKGTVNLGQPLNEPTQAGQFKSANTEKAGFKMAAHVQTDHAAEDAAAKIAATAKLTAKLTQAFGKYADAISLTGDDKAHFVEEQITKSEPLSAEERKHLMGDMSSRTSNAEKFRKAFIKVEGQLDPDDNLWAAAAADPKSPVYKIAHNMATASEIHEFRKAAAVTEIEAGVEGRLNANKVESQIAAGTAEIKNALAKTESRLANDVRNEAGATTSELKAAVKLSQAVSVNQGDLTRQDVDQRTRDLAGDITKDGDTTRGAVKTDGDLTRNAITADGTITRTAMTTDGGLTRTAVTADGNTTRTAVATDGGLTRTAVTADGDTTRAAVTTDGGLTRTALETLRVTPAAAPKAGFIIGKDNQLHVVSAGTDGKFKDEAGQALAEGTIVSTLQPDSSGDSKVKRYEVDKDGIANELQTPKPSPSVVPSGTNSPTVQ